MKENHLNTIDSDLSATRERERIVSFLRKRANAPHPIERGIPSLSPAGRGLLLLMADQIERGEHEGEHEGNNKEMKH